MKVDYAVAVHLDEDDLKEAVKRYVETEAKHLKVSSVEFESKRNPARIEVNVTASADTMEDSGDKPEAAKVEAKKVVEETESRKPRTNKNTEANHAKAKSAMKRLVKDKEPEPEAKESDVEDQEELPFDGDDTVEETQSEAVPDTSLMDEAIAEADQEEQEEAMAAPKEEKKPTVRKSLFAKK